MEPIYEALKRQTCDMDRTAQQKFESFLHGKNTEYMEGYTDGASHQCEIDIEKACDAYCKCCETKDCIQENVCKEDCYFRNEYKNFLMELIEE